MPARVGKGWAAKGGSRGVTAEARTGHLTPYDPRAVKRPPKFGNLKCEVDGFKFDSVKEAQRYGTLKMLEQAGKIRNLRLQTRHPLSAPGVDGQPVVVAHYVADFDYEEPNPPLAPDAGRIATLEWSPWRPVTEDVKGGRATQTETFKLKARWFAVLYGRAVRIT